MSHRAAVTVIQLLHHHSPRPPSPHHTRLQNTSRKNSGNGGYKGNKRLQLHGEVALLELECRSA